MNFDDSAYRKISDVSFAVLDVETTGMSARYNRIIEIGIAFVTNGKITGTYQTFLNPGVPIPAEITAITGIRNEDVRHAPFFEQISDDLIALLENHVFAAHNLTFDFGFMQQEFSRAGYETFQPLTVCTLRLGRRLFPELRSKSLSSLLLHLKIENDQAHRALSDANATAKLLMKTIAILEKQHDISVLQDMLAFQYKAAHTIKQKKPKTIEDEFSLLPDLPGVYSFIDAKGKVIYVGKAKSLRDRIRSYLMPGSPKKAKNIISRAKHIKIQTTSSECTALLTEAELIKVLTPRYNIQLKQYRNKYFIKIQLDSPFPKLDLTLHFEYDGNDYFGLFVSRKKAEEVINILHRSFLLRECEEKALLAGRECILAQIGRCTAPCVNGDEVIYKEELNRVYEFLYGKNQEAVNRLLHKMKEHSNKKQYEQAGEIKGLIDSILKQMHQAALIAEPVNKAQAVFEISGKGGERDYIAVVEGKVAIKRYLLNKGDEFEQMLDDYFAGTIHTTVQTTEEDLEKMKIILNWVVKNRASVRIYYLKEFPSKEALYLKLSRMRVFRYAQEEGSFEIKELLEKMKLN